MDLSEIEIEKLAAFVINELKIYGVKCHKEKKKKYTQKKGTIRNIFCTHLHLLDLSDVILANGKAVKVPTFLTASCSRVLEQGETEGLFRKAGSIARQREIRASLEAGEELKKTNHVIDVANVIKYFFRELPLPLITPCIQDALLQCLLVEENNIDAMLLACLLLPPLAFNTLCFFLQFLHTISLSESRNKMNVQNLAIIFTPALIPFPHVKSQRFFNHVKILRILIENANSVGNIPSRIELKLRETSDTQTSEGYFNNLSQKSKNKITENNGQIPESTKKKRRSDIFHGLRKIVGSTMGSTELLDNSYEVNKPKLILPKSDKKIDKTNLLIEDTSSYNKKRKNLQSYSGFTTKKKETKKSRLSLGGEQILKNISIHPIATSAERRWSVVASGCSKNKCVPYKMCYETDAEFSGSKDDGKSNKHFRASQFLLKNNSVCEELTLKVKALESSASKEILPNQVPLPQNESFSGKTRRPDHMQSQNDMMASETVSQTSPSSEELVHCLSHKLYVQKNVNHSKVCSPRERKTEVISRRSPDNLRNYRCNIELLNTSPEHEKPLSILEFQNTQTPLKSSGHLNQSLGGNISLLPSKNDNSIALNDRLNEQWLPGEEFFMKTQTKHSNCQVNENFLNSMHFENFATPVRIKTNANTVKTPMLPPKSLPRKTTDILNHLDNVLPNPTTSIKLNRRLAISTPDIEEINGRASIARLREENAGMVMAKAKLFDSLETKAYNRQSKAAEQNSARIHSSASNTPVVSTSEQHFRNVSKQLTKSIVNNGNSSSKPYTGSYENARKINAKPATLKTFNTSHNTMSSRRTRK